MGLWWPNVILVEEERSSKLYIYWRSGVTKSLEPADFAIWIAEQPETL